MRKNVLLKLSGEAFGDKNTPFLPEVIQSYANAIAKGLAHRKTVYAVCGGGNVCRGRSFGGNVLTDYAGMLASVQNGLFLTIALSELGIKSQLVLPDNFTIPYGCHECDVEEETRVVIYAGGVGFPGHSTDYICAVKAVEHDCDVYFAKFGVDGVYAFDPNNAALVAERGKPAFIENVSFAEIVDKKLGIIDLEAAELLCKTDCKGYIFSLTADNIASMLCGDEEEIHKTTIH